MDNFIIHEVGLRDGLQMESQTVPFDTKVAWTEDLIKSGIKLIQLGSFVHPTRMPQMADTDKLFSHFSDADIAKDIVLSGLVLNEKGMERGMACGVEMFCMGVSASDTHSNKNTRMSTEEAQERIIKMAKETMNAGKRVQASVQSAFGCGFEGHIDEEKVLSIVKRYLDAGIKNISLADTAGHANPAQVARLFAAVKDFAPEAEMACHFHNTYGMGLANCLAAMQNGVKFIETAFGGIGGCPFTKLAAGNVCTEDYVHFVQRMGQNTDIDIDGLINVTKSVQEFFQRDLPGYVYKAGALKY